MTESTFNQCFDWIEKYHGKTGHLDVQVRADWMDEFRKEDDEVFFEAANLATDKMPPGMFPSKERMRGFVAEAREKLWNKIKASEPKKPLTELFEKLEARDPEKVTEGEDALRTMLRFKESHRDPVDAYLELDQRWPGHGWDVAAHDLRKLRATIREKMEKRETQSLEPKASHGPSPGEREFADIHEKAEFYRKLFAGETE